MASCYAFLTVGRLIYYIFVTSVTQITETSSGIKGKVRPRTGHEGPEGE
jgi:hypothetical protein